MGDVIDPMTHTEPIIGATCHTCKRIVGIGESCHVLTVVEWRPTEVPGLSLMKPQTGHWKVNHLFSGSALPFLTGTLEEAMAGAEFLAATDVDWTRTMGEIRQTDEAYDAAQDLRHHYRRMNGE